MDSEREEEGGKIWENGIETCKISCMKQKKKTIKHVYFYKLPELLKKNNKIKKKKKRQRN